MASLYTVYGSSGNRRIRAEWVIGIYLDEAEANFHRDRANDRASSLGISINEAPSNYPEATLAQMGDLDPFISEVRSFVSTTGLSYEVRETALQDQAPNADGSHRRVPLTGQERAEIQTLWAGYQSGSTQALYDLATRAGVSPAKAREALNQGNANNVHALFIYDDEDPPSQAQAAAARVRTK